MRLQVSDNSRSLPRHVIRAAMRFYAEALSLNPKVNIALRFTSKYPRKVGAEMWPILPYKRRFTIKCSSKNGPYRVLNDLAHEMIHIGQYLDGTMTETDRGTMWKGRVYRGDLDKNDAYWNAPWEIDANGRTYWLYKRCRLHLRKQGYRLRK